MRPPVVRVSTRRGAQVLEKTDLHRSAARCYAALMDAHEGNLRAARAQVTRHASSLGRWELATAPPAAPLQPFAREYVGWAEDMAVPLCRRELPTEEVPLIINFGSPFHLFAPGTTQRQAHLTSFVTGAYDTFPDRGIPRERRQWRGPR